jgi:hypothetical protein
MTHPQVTHHGRVNPAPLHHQVRPGLRALVEKCLSLASPAVLQLLFELTFRRAVVLHTPFDRTPPAVHLFAPERTPQVLTAGITWMRQEEYPAVPTACQTLPKAWIGPQHGPEHEIVLQHEIPDFAAAVPARLELKMFLDFNYQKPSVSLMMFKGDCTASSYTIGTPCVER